MTPCLLFFYGLFESTTLSLQKLFRYYLSVFRDEIIVLLLRCGLPRKKGLRPLADALVDAAPTGRHSFSVILLNQSKRRVMELDQRSTVGLAQAVLYIRDHRIGHEQRPADFEQRRPLDGLHVSPEMTVAIAQIAVPPSPWPRLNLHGHRGAFHDFIVRSQLFEQCSEGHIQGRTDMDFLSNVQCQILSALCCRNHGSSLNS